LSICAGAGVKASCPAVWVRNAKSLTTRLLVAGDVIRLMMFFCNSDLNSVICS